MYGWGRKKKNQNSGSEIDSVGIGNKGKKRVVIRQKETHSGSIMYQFVKANIMSEFLNQRYTLT